MKWYDAEKGFGFLSQEDGEDVYVRSSALPAGIEGLKAGQRVEFGLATGRRGPQALMVKLIDPAPSLARTMVIAIRITTDNRGGDVICRDNPNYSPNADPRFNNQDWAECRR